MAPSEIYDIFANSLKITCMLLVIIILIPTNHATNGRNFKMLKYRKYSYKKERGIYRTKRREGEDDTMSEGPNDGNTEGDGDILGWAIAGDSVSLST